MSTRRIVPCTAGAAKRWILATHRHLPEVTGGRWAAACAINGRVESKLAIIQSIRVAVLGGGAVKVDPHELEVKP